MAIPIILPKIFLLSPIFLVFPAIPLPISDNGYGASPSTDFLIINPYLGYYTENKGLALSPMAYSLLIITPLVIGGIILRISERYFILLALGPIIIIFTK